MAKCPKKHAEYMKRWRMPPLIRCGVTVCMAAEKRTDAWPRPCN